MAILLPFVYTLADSTKGVTFNMQNQTVVVDLLTRSFRTCITRTTDGYFNPRLVLTIDGALPFKYSEYIINSLRSYIYTVGAWDLPEHYFTDSQKSYPITYYENGHVYAPWEALESYCTTTFQTPASCFTITVIETDYSIFCSLDMLNFVADGNHYYKSPISAFPFDNMDVISGIRGFYPLLIKPSTMLLTFKPVGDTYHYTAKAELADKVNKTLFL